MISANSCHHYFKFRSTAEIRRHFLNRIWPCVARPVKLLWPPLIRSRSAILWPVLSSHSAVPLHWRTSPPYRNHTRPARLQGDSAGELATVLRGSDGCHGRRSRFRWNFDRAGGRSNDARGRRRLRRGGRRFGHARFLDKIFEARHERRDGQFGALVELLCRSGRGAEDFNVPVPRTDDQLGPKRE